MTRVLWETQDGTRARRFTIKRPMVQAKQTILGGPQINKHDDPLSHWTFKVEEISPGVYRFKGNDPTGRSLERQGTDPEALMVECRRIALSMKKAGTA